MWNRHHPIAQELHAACLHGDAAAVSRLLPAGGTLLNHSGADFQASADDDTPTPLMRAAQRGYKDIVRMILERAPNTAVDYANSRGVTALMKAAHFRHSEIIRLLADRGADVSRVNWQRVTALRLAVTLLSPPPLGDTESPRRDPDPGAELATVRALLQLGACTLPTPAPFLTCF
jgi:ankyrin repeat protein